MSNRDEAVYITLITVFTILFVLAVLEVGKSFLEDYERHGPLGIQLAKELHAIEVRAHDGCNNQDDDGDGAVDNIGEFRGSMTCYRFFSGECWRGTWRCNMAAGAGKNYPVCMLRSREESALACELIAG